MEGASETLFGIGKLAFPTHTTRPEKFNYQLDSWFTFDFIGTKAGQAEAESH